MSYTKSYQISLIITLALIIIVIIAVMALGACDYAYDRGFNDGLYLNTKLGAAKQYLK